MNINKKKYNKRIFKEGLMKQFPLLNLYILVFIVLQLIGDIFHIFFLRMLKPLPIILMILYIHMKNSSRQHLIATLVQYGLIFSLIGDILLMVPQYQAFALGTGVFMIAHIIYIVAFRMGYPFRQPSFKTNFILYGGVIFCIVNYVINSYVLWQVLPNKILFSAYGFIVLINISASILRYKKTTPYSFYFIMFGSLLFGVSDHLLGFLKFNNIQSDLGRAGVMLTYYSAQFLIMHGALHHSNLQYNIDLFLKNKPNP